MPPRVSARALIQSEGNVLLVTYCDRAGDWYVLPGGGQTSGETLHACLIREVEEETSLTVHVGRLRWVREFIAADFPESDLDPDFHQIELIFECSIQPGQDAQIGTVPDRGQRGLCWLAIEELLHVRFFPQEIASILNNRRPDRSYLGAV